MKTLVVVPHLDDEAISCGGLIKARSEKGTVFVLTAHTRRYDYVNPSPAVWEREEQDFLAAKHLLGYAWHRHLLFTEGEPGEVGFYRLLREIEGVMARFEPDEVVIPSQHDLNQDHRHLNHVMQIALRPINLGNVKRVLEFFALDGTTKQPNFLVQLTGLQFEAKINAVAAYRKEARIAGPRALVNIEAQARVWGSMTGKAYAEGYNLRLEIDNAGSNYGRERVHRDEPDAISGAHGAEHGDRDS